MDLFDLSISNSPASLMLIIPDRPDHSLRQQDAPPPQGTASEPFNLDHAAPTDRTQRRKDGSTRVAAQRIAVEARLEEEASSSSTTGRTWHSAEQESRDGKERRVSTTTTRTCKFTFRARCSNPDASVSALGGGGWRQAAGPHCPFGPLGARTFGREPGFPDHPRLPPCEDYRVESNGPRCLVSHSTFFCSLAADPQT